MLYRTQVDEVLSPFSSWLAHDGEITSVKLAMHETQPLVITGAADCSVRVWNFNGHYIGTFGQVSKQLLQKKEYHHDGSSKNLIS